jgi:hypothetical protein
MTTVDTAFPGKSLAINRAARFSRKTDARNGRFLRVSETGRKIAAVTLRAGFGILALAAICALQAAFCVYVWRLPV